MAHQAAGRAGSGNGARRGPDGAGDAVGPDAVVGEGIAEPVVSREGVKGAAPVVAPPKSPEVAGDSDELLSTSKPEPWLAATESACGLGLGSQQVVRRDGDRRGVEPAGQRRADRNVAP